MANPQTASDLLEQGQAQEASKLYEELGYHAHAAFAAILDSKLDRAKQLNQTAPHSPLSKWVDFVTSFLEASQNQRLLSPGYLTCRLYTEATIGYLIKYQLNDYLERFIRCRHDLVVIYPEIIKDIGSSYLAQKDYNRALEFLNEAKQRFAQDAGLYYKSAVAYIELGEPARAKPCVDRLAGLLPGSTLIANLREHLGQLGD